MTKRELLRELEDVPMDMPVVIQVYYDSGYANTTRDIEEIQFDGRTCNLLAEGDG